jgi:hypothetical protein
VLSYNLGIDKADTCSLVLLSSGEQKTTTRKKHLLKRTEEKR